MSNIKLNPEQTAMLAGKRGVAKQMAMRLVLDMAAAAGASELVPIQSAHISGVSPLTGGLGLRLFLKKLGQDTEAKVAIPTTLNSAGADSEQFDEMKIVAPDFLEHNNEIVAAYTKLGIMPTQSCIPYEWEGVVSTGTAAWAESNAICFGNSYTGLNTNRESGLSALAASLTGYTPKYGLLKEGATKPNHIITVTAHMSDPADFSLLGDWMGMVRPREWKFENGPIPLIRGLSSTLAHQQKKALTAAAANYGCPKLYIEGHVDVPEFESQGELIFDDAALQQRYAELYPPEMPSLIVLGCPQASVAEIKAAAELLRGKRISAVSLWVFTSRQNKELATALGYTKMIEDAGALLLADTCPEVVPYDQAWVKRILTNSMKAEHYIKSGLNGIPTSVMKLRACVEIAMGERKVERRKKKEEARGQRSKAKGKMFTKPTSSSQLPTPNSSFTGKGLPSQTDFSVTGEAFVTDAPITLLGFVNRETGVIEEPGHPADGQSMAGKIAIFPKGSGSTVAPYVLLELFYRGNAPLAIANTEIDQQSAPACSLENIPYAYGFDGDIIAGIQNGDQVKLERKGGEITLSLV